MEKYSPNNTCVTLVNISDLHHNLIKTHNLIESYKNTFYLFIYYWYKIATVQINTHKKEHTVCTMQHICTKRKLSKVHAE